MGDKGQTHTNWKDQDPETAGLFNYIYRTQGKEAAYDFMDLAAGKEFTKRQVAAMGAAQGMGLTSALGAITGVAGKLTGTEEAARERREGSRVLIRAMKSHSRGKG